MIEVGCRDVRHTLVIWVSVTDLLYTAQGSEQNKGISWMKWYSGDQESDQNKVLGD